MLLNCLYTVLSDNYRPHPMGEIDFCTESYVLSAVYCFSAIALVITHRCLFSFLSVYLLWKDLLRGMRDLDCHICCYLTFSIIFC